MSVRLTWLTLLALHIAPLLVGWRFGWSAGVPCMFAMHVWLAASTFVPGINIWGRTLRSFRTSKREVCLTIDDGPTEDTPEILAILDDAGAKAVFFLIGSRVAANPALCRAIQERGHLLGNHTQNHPRGWFWSYFPPAQRREIAGASRAIYDACGEEVRIFRPPVGFRNLFNAPVLRELGLRNIGWSARGFDGIDTDVERILQRILRSLRPGAIILLHQGKPYRAVLLRRLLAELKAGGWEVEIPPELR